MMPISAVMVNERVFQGIAEGSSAVGTWGHKFALPNGNLNGYGCMNQPGLSLCIGMVLAREAGVRDPALDRAIANFEDAGKQLAGTKYELMAKNEVARIRAARAGALWHVGRRVVNVHTRVMDRSVQARAYATGLLAAGGWLGLERWSRHARGGRWLLPVAVALAIAVGASQVKPAVCSASRTGARASTPTKMSRSTSFVARGKPQTPSAWRPAGTVATNISHG